MLIVIDKGQAGNEDPHPLLFADGACHGGWCWNEHFLDFFASRGLRALALNPGGHGSTQRKNPLRICSIADFLADLASAVHSLSRPPVLVGDSMGGFLVQKYLETQALPAAILIASTPPRGQPHAGPSARQPAIHRSFRTKPCSDTDVLVRELPSFFIAAGHVPQVNPAIAEMKDGCNRSWNLPNPTPLAPDN
ncbi:alpha/beta fold hydrolase [Mycobacterium sp. 852002-40037_SCH5390672]|uniref:alpha/beta hydrolase n=1 Tax=Mycobacterium sp. 852002-40037_SCH5390672 TaxID=1834089 RepID=UPI0009ED5B3A